MVRAPQEEDTTTCLFERSRYDHKCMNLVVSDGEDEDD